MRFRARVDSNHGEIVDAFRAMGVAVQSLAQLGGGVPDLMVAFGGVTWVIEVKSDDGDENKKQREWAEKWKGVRMLIRDVQGVETAVRTMRLQAIRLQASDRSA